MRFNIITIFPEIFNSYFNESIIKRAQKNNLIKINIHNLRDWTKDKHKTVDDAPYGGGAGMVMKVDILYKALKTIVKNKKKTKIILFSAKGKKWNQQLAKKYSKFDSIIMVCGRYEGVDERILNFIDDEISIGDYVLTGGEIPAMTVVDSITRLLPGVLGNATSSKDESHSISGQLEYPQYTRPKIFTVGKKKYRVPKILLSGDHGKIAQWRNKKIKKQNNYLPPNTCAVKTNNSTSLSL
ncbi:MAG: tRNA (guanine-N(1)-)-methyltransferase [Parcubacteria group bacterium ADurb.Bin316]|nr:MAG: tRNA (guanine-N(1)-)-methyltransferase [Parcubacteria group bacterium ADurb.Bin316]HOZ55809.1 tRNA (guanosine(37)-N1)-methyltransferase TrmD [bacterium]